MKPFFQKTELESVDVQGPSIAYAKTKRWFIEAIQSKSRKGFPDTFAARDGEIVLVEFKTLAGEARRQQLLRHQQLRAAGVRVEVCHSLADAKRIFE